MESIPSWLRPFLELSYPVSKPSCDNFFPQSQHYVKGPADLLFVLTWGILFALLREVVMRSIFGPFMRMWITSRTRRKSGPSVPEESTGLSNGISISNGHGGSDLKHRLNGKTETSATNGHTQPRSETTSAKANERDRAKERKIIRFAEQGWSFTYYSIYWPIGYYIHLHSPWYPFNLDHLWIGYPETHQSLPGLVKFYYLTQFAFWLNQVVIINVEARRKDYWQMMSHHIITTILIVGSYTMDYTRVGCLVLVLFDFCDIFLPLAKMLKYMAVEPLPDIVFGIFLIGWLATRQFLFSLLVLSVIRDAPRIMPFVDDGIPGAVLTRRAWLTYSLLLSGLEVIFLFWLYLIVRIAYKAIAGTGVEDIRSDDESD